MFPPNSPHMERIRVKNENDQMNRMAARRRTQQNWSFTIVKRLFEVRRIFQPMASPKRQVEARATQTSTHRRVESL